MKPNKEQLAMLHLNGYKLAPVERFNVDQDKIFSLYEQNGYTHIAWDSEDGLFRQNIGSKIPKELLKALNRLWENRPIHK